jgi:hypothetical protein
MAIATSNKGLYKKAYYGFNRQPPVVVSSSLGLYNANEFIKHYSYYRIPTLGVDSPAIIFGEYEERLIAFVWEESMVITFETPFSSQPIVVVQPEENDYSNVAHFVSDISETGFTVQLSSGFSGSLRYRAVYWESYPVLVERSPLSSSFYYSASAGNTEVESTSEFISMYSSLGNLPTEIFFSPVGNMVSLVDSGSFGLTGTSGSLSTPISGSINFLAVL